MKVDVLTVQDVEIKRFRWWSDWIDVCVFNHGYTGHLLQMKISRINSKRFRAKMLSGSVFMYGISCDQVGDLTQMKK